MSCAVPSWDGTAGTTAATSGRPWTVVATCPAAVATADASVPSTRTSRVDCEPGPKPSTSRS